MTQEQWTYDRLIRDAGLAMYAPTKGCIVILPYGYAIWENVKEYLDARIKKLGHLNAYFPLLIPEGLLGKEKDHVEGFSPECAVVTHGGGVELTEKLIIRPTSETIMYEVFKDLVHSYRDLPLLINQWANVVRWERRPRPFLRTTEFLWQEGHTAHATHQEALEEVLLILEEYKMLAEKVLAIPVVAGKKSDNERFAGAQATYTIEGLMLDGRALQCGTSHDLGQNFARAFGITFRDRNNAQQHVWQTSWGVSTRLIGALVMMHKDERGLVLPPTVAPYQAVVVPVGEENEPAYLEKVERCLDDSKIRYRIDASNGTSAGFKFAAWEMKGVPLRIEVGRREAENDTITVAFRTGGKETYPFDSFMRMLPILLNDVQNLILHKALDFRDRNTYDIDSLMELADRFSDDGGNGFARVHFCGSASCEDEIKAKTHGATCRCFPLDGEEEEGHCIVCQSKTKGPKALFAKAY
ncbi:MAG: proline--tRNA ligase [Bacteroidetes bacterium]|nr:proline--tRNA ligase [Bacteroidota bacterium]